MPPVATVADGRPLRSRRLDGERTSHEKSCSRIQLSTPAALGGRRLHRRCHHSTGRGPRQVPAGRGVRPARRGPGGARRARSLAPRRDRHHHDGRAGTGSLRRLARDRRHAASPGPHPSSSRLVRSARRAELLRSDGPERRRAAGRTAAAGRASGGGTVRLDLDRPHQRRGPHRERRRRSSQRLPRLRWRDRPPLASGLRSLALGARDRRPAGQHVVGGRRPRHARRRRPR